MNEHDSERIAGLLETDGYVSTDQAADAEVVVFNTCAIRENADNRLYGSLGHLKPLKDRNPSMRIIVAGCLAQKDQGTIQERAPWVDVVIGTHALPSLLELLRAAERDGPQMDVREYTEVFPSALPARRGSRHHAWVSVSVGCDNRCTFCIVPLVRGPQLSATSSRRCRAWRDRAWSRSPSSARTSTRTAATSRFRVRTANPCSPSSSAR